MLLNSSKFNFFILPKVLSIISPISSNDCIWYLYSTFDLSVFNGSKLRIILASSFSMNPS